MTSRKLVAASTIAVALMLGSATSHAQKSRLSAKKLDALESQALATMKAKADELKIQGVAVVSWVPGDSVQSWTSKMAVVGRLTDPAASDGKGNDLLAIAYAKSAEMANTLKDSGTVQGRTPMTGEFGWQGGVLEHLPNGWLIVAFSGGKSEDDVQVSKAGMAAIKGNL
jgi:hypothetical protein